jgi:hypothetical protein
MAKKKGFDPDAFDKKADPATNPPAKTQDFDVFAPLKNKQAETTAAPPKTYGDGTVGGALKEAGRAADNFARAYADDWTYGLLDKTIGGDEAKKTIAAKDELGTGGRLAAGTMAALTNPVTAGIKTGGLIKSGVVGAGQGALDAYGHGGSLSDIAWGTGTGAAVGTGLHGLGLGIAEGARKLGPKIANTTVGKSITDLVDSVQARAGIKTPAAITAAADADRAMKFRQLDSVEFNPRDTLAGARSVQAQLYGGTTPKWLETDTPGTSGTMRRYVGNMINAQQGGQNAGAGSLHSVLRDLNEIISKKAGSEDAKAAMEAKDQVQQMFNNIRPINAPQGVAKQYLDEANASHGTYQNALMLERMKGQLDERGTMPGSEANQILDDKNRAGFYNPEQKAALKDIGKTGGGTVGNVDGSSVVLPAVGGLGAAATGGHGWGPLAAGVGLGGAIDATRRLATKAGARQAIADSYPAMTGNFMQNPEQQTLRSLKYVGLGSLSGDNGSPTPYQYMNNPYSGYINDALPDSWRR